MLWINVIASALIHSERVAARIRSASPAGPELENTTSRIKQMGPMTRAAIITGLSRRHSGRAFSRRQSGNGVITRTAKAMVATIASVMPPGLWSWTWAVHPAAMRWQGIRGKELPIASPATASIQGA